MQALLDPIPSLHAIGMSPQNMVCAPRLILRLRRWRAIAMRRIKSRVKDSTWDAFRLSALDGLSGVDAAGQLGIPVGNVFVAKHRVHKMLQEEVRILKNEPG